MFFAKGGDGSEVNDKVCQSFQAIQSDSYAIDAYVFLKGIFSNNSKSNWRKIR